MATPSHDELCRRIVETAPDAIIFADRDGIIRLWNTGASVVIGYGADGAVGRSLDLIIPERLRARHWEGYHRVMATGETRYGRELLSVPAVRKDGTRISVEFSIAQLRDEYGRPIGIAAILRDVTARWERDRALRHRLAEAEARLRAAEPAEGDASPSRDAGEPQDR